MEILIVSIIILAVFISLITEILPIDVIAIGSMVILATLRILTPREAVSGFANPAVITVGSMFLISHAMIRTGAVGFLGEKIISLSKGNSRTAILFILLIVGVTSAFINNTPVVVLFIPIMMSVSCEYDFSPSKVLIPVSYVSILSGTCSLIGTSTNIIVSDLSAMYGYGDLGMFELSRLGVPIAVLGIAFLYTFSSYLLPGNTAPTCELDDRSDRRYLAEFIIPTGSKLIDMEADDAFTGDYPSFEIFEVSRGSQIFYPERDKLVFSENDLILLKGSPTDLLSALNNRIVELPHVLKDISFIKDKDEPIVAELIIPPQSSLLGEKLLATDISGIKDLHIIAVKRRSLFYTEQKIQSLRLRIGDIILVYCTERKLQELKKEMDFIIVEDVHHEIIEKRKAPWAVGIFLSLIITVTVGLVDIMIGALAAVFILFLSGCIRLRDAYKSLQGDVLFLIAGTIAIPMAMEKSGASSFYAEKFLFLFKGLGPAAVLGGILVLTSAGSHLLSNNATAVLLFPVAVSTAISLGVNPKPFIVAVCFGASACYATPIGYTTNLLVFGPGGYRFGDYIKLGIPVNLLVLIMGGIFIPFFWPF